jgi:hypothetical protein
MKKRGVLSEDGTGMCLLQKDTPYKLFHRIIRVYPSLRGLAGDGEALG